MPHATDVWYPDAASDAGSIEIDSTPRETVQNTITYFNPHPMSLAHQALPSVTSKSIVMAPYGRNHKYTWPSLVVCGCYASYSVTYTLELFVLPGQVRALDGTLGHIEANTMNLLRLICVALLLFIIITILTDWELYL